MSWLEHGSSALAAIHDRLTAGSNRVWKPVKAVRFQNGWIEFDTNEDYETAVKWTGEGFLEQFIKL